MPKERFSPSKGELSKTEIYRLALENAKNGVTASAILGLDLSTEEGREKLQEILSPWDPSGGRREFRNIKIILSDKSELFPYKTFSEEKFCTEFFLISAVDIINRILAKFSQTKELKEKLSLLGHGLQKASPELRDAFNVPDNKAGYEKFDREDPRFFIIVLAETIKISVEALNMSITGNFLSILANTSKETSEHHPNFKTLKKLLDEFESFVYVWKDSFYKHLTNVMQGNKYDFSEVMNGFPSSDFSLTGKMFRERNSAEKDILKLEDEVEKGVFIPEIEEKALSLIEKIEGYKKTLEGYNAHT